jgi:hypothetical protein
MSAGPFFSYYGSKWRGLLKYPAPACDIIVEPFAGGACYSTRHCDRKVLLIDLNPVVAGVWEYLIRASAAEVLALPDIAPGQRIADLPLCQEAKWLIGFWCTKGVAHPANKPTKWMIEHPTGGFWGPRIRERLARQVERIRHWQVRCDDYRNAPDIDATWFVDPPYKKGGEHYPKHVIDYDELRAWIFRRKGERVVTENHESGWMPSKHRIPVRTTLNRKNEEAYWHCTDNAVSRIIATDAPLAVTRTCGVCGTDITSARADARHCGDTCRQRSYRLRNQPATGAQQPSDG